MSIAKKCTTNILHLLLLDLPLLLLFTSLLFLDTLHHVTHTYLYPIYTATQFADDDQRILRERTYTPPTADTECTADDISTSTTDDILLDPTIHTVQDAVDTTLKHGVSAYRNILSQKTTSELREWITYKNANHNIFETYYYGVQQGKHRAVVYPNAADHPSLIAALKELTSHTLLVNTLESLLGSNPAVYELSFITSYTGAIHQNWHHDLTSCHSHYSLTFAPSFSLFIPLQNTTQSMGASEFCPGTHLCVEMDTDECDEYGFPLTTSEENDDSMGGEPFWKAGDGALYNGKMYHRGGGHEHDHDRILMIVSFTPRPYSHAEYRIPGLGTTWGIKYNMFGHTLDDLRHAEKVMVQPWATLRAFGLYKLPHTDWGWDYVTLAVARIANEDPGFDSDDYKDFLKNGCNWAENMDDLPAWLVGDLEDYRENIEDKAIFWDFGVETLDRLVKVVNYAYRGALGVYCLVVIVFGLVRMQRDKMVHSKKNKLVMTNGSNGVEKQHNGKTDRGKNGHDAHHTTNGNNDMHSNQSQKQNTTTTTTNTTFTKVFQHLIHRLSLLHIPIFLLYIYTNNTISSSQWANEIDSNILFHPPFPTHPVDVKDDDLFIAYLRSVASVRNEDVLFTTIKIPGASVRSSKSGGDDNNAAVIGSKMEMNRVVESVHEGNQQFNTLVSEFVPPSPLRKSLDATTTMKPTKPTILPLNLIQHAAKQIVQEMVLTSSSRFLLQNEYGDYTPLSYTQAVSKTQWVLIKKSNLVLQTLQDTLQEMESMYRYGPNRHKVLYKTWSVDFVDYWSVTLKKEWIKRKKDVLEEQQRTLFQKVDKEKKKKEEKTMVPVPTLLFSFTSRASKAIDDDEPISSSLEPMMFPSVQRYSGSSIASLHPEVTSTPTQKCINDKQSSLSAAYFSNPPIREFEIGDEAEFWEGGNSTRWVHGTIEDKFEGDQYSDIHYHVKNKEGELMEDVRGDELRSLDDMDIVW